MSLDWDISKCKNNEILRDGDEWLITRDLIHFTMGIELGEITEKNAQDFWERCYIWNSVFEIYNFPFSIDDIERRVGLRTNVITKSRAFFMKKIASILDRQAKEAYRRQDKKRKEENSVTEASGAAERDRSI